MVPGTEKAEPSSQSKSNSKKKTKKYSAPSEVSSVPPEPVSLETAIPSISSPELWMPIPIASEEYRASILSTYLTQHNLSSSLSSPLLSAASNVLSEVPESIPTQFLTSCAFFSRSKAHICSYTVPTASVPRLKSALSFWSKLHGLFPLAPRVYSIKQDSNHTFSITKIAVSPSHKDFKKFQSLFRSQMLFTELLSSPDLPKDYSSLFIYDPVLYSILLSPLLPSSHNSQSSPLSITTTTTTSNPSSSSSSSMHSIMRSVLHYLQSYHNSSLLEFHLGGSSSSNSHLLWTSSQRIRLFSLVGDSLVLDLIPLPSSRLHFLLLSLPAPPAHPESPIPIVCGLFRCSFAPVWTSLQTFLLSKCSSFLPRPPRVIYISSADPTDLLASSPLALANIIASSTIPAFSPALVPLPNLSSLSPLTASVFAASCPLTFSRKLQLLRRWKWPKSSISLLSAACDLAPKCSPAFSDNPTYSPFYLSSHASNSNNNDSPSALLAASFASSLHTSLSRSSSAFTAITAALPEPTAAWLETSPRLYSLADLTQPLTPASIRSLLLPPVLDNIRAILGSGTFVAADSSFCLDPAPSGSTTAAPTRVPLSAAGCACCALAHTGCPCRHLLALAALGKRPVTLRDFDTRWLVQQPVFAAAETIQMGPEPSQTMELRALRTGWASRMEIETVPPCPTVLAKITVTRDMEKAIAEGLQFTRIPVGLPEAPKMVFVSAEDMWKVVSDQKLDSTQVDSFYLIKEENVDGDADDITLAARMKAFAAARNVKLSAKHVREHLDDRRNCKDEPKRKKNREIVPGT